MAAKGKDITALLSTINATIDPQAPVGGITATAHNAMLLQLASDVGWMGDFFYEIANMGEAFPDGFILLQTQNYNDSTATIWISRIDGFGSNLQFILGNMGPDSTIVIRDIDGDIINWKVTAALGLEQVNGQSWYYKFSVIGDASNSDKTLGQDVTKVCGVQLNPYALNPTFIDSSKTISDADNDIEFDFGKYTNWRYNIKDITSSGPSVFTAINLVEGQSGFISFERDWSIGAISQFGWSTDFIDISPKNTSENTIVDLNWKVIYFYTIVNNNIYFTNQYGFTG